MHIHPISLSLGTSKSHMGMVVVLVIVLVVIYRFTCMFVHVGICIRCMRCTIL